MSPFGSTSTSYCYCPAWSWGSVKSSRWIRQVLEKMIHHQSQNSQYICCYVCNIFINIVLDLTAILRGISVKGFTVYFKFSAICNEIYDIAAAVVDVFRGAILYGRRNPSLVSSNMALHPSSPTLLRQPLLCHKTFTGCAMKFLTECLIAAFQDHIKICVVPYLSVVTDLGSDHGYMDDE